MRRLAALLAAALIVAAPLANKAPAAASAIHVHVYEYAPNYGTPIACGSRTTATRVYATITATAYGPAPQPVIEVDLNGTNLWDDRHEPAGIATGTHEYGWVSQALTAPGAWRFHAYLFDQPAIPADDCTIIR
jgi:hypothetical protein